MESADQCEHQLSAAQMDKLMLSVVEQQSLYDDVPPLYNHIVGCFSPRMY